MLLAACSAVWIVRGIGQSVKQWGPGFALAEWGRRPRPSLQSAAAVHAAGSNRFVAGQETALAIGKCDKRSRRKSFQTPS